LHQSAKRDSAAYLLLRVPPLQAPKPQADGLDAAACVT
jgi:hypothetical protein